MHFLSVLGSVFILQSILRHPANRVRVSNRIMVALSLSDVMFSTACLFGEISIPKGQHKFAHGTVFSCSINGFFDSLGFHTSTLYSATLAVCYLLTVRFGWKEDKLHRIWVQFLLVVFPMAAMLPQHILAVVWGSANMNGLGYCANFSPYPLGCDGNTIQCERGAKIKETWYGHGNLGNALGIMWPSIVALPIVVTCMCILYLHVLRREQANDRYNFDGDHQQRSRSRQVATQGIFYVLVFLTLETPWVATAFYSAQGKNPPLVLL